MYCMFFQDITSGDAQKELTKVFRDCCETTSSDSSPNIALVVCSSAVPSLDFTSLPTTIIGKMFGFKDAKPSFYFTKGQSPKQVDYDGQLAQFNAARDSGIVNHVVLVSSMAGTQKDHFLNKNMGNMVLWKRKAEIKLVQSGLSYTILHPGGLLPHVGTGHNESSRGGKRALVVGLDDELLKRTDRYICHTS